jgi:hypothetical protein
MAEATNRKITTGDGWNIPSKYLPETEYRDLPHPLFRGGFASHGLLGSNSGGYLTAPFIVAAPGLGSHSERRNPLRPGRSRPPMLDPSPR